MHLTKKQNNAQACVNFHIRPVILLCRPGVGNLFCTADRFETEIFSRTGVQIATNVQQ